MTSRNHHLGMLMACASPGSALAYHLGLATFGSDMVRRNIATDRLADGVQQSVIEEPLNEADMHGQQRPLASTRGWLGRAFHRLHAWTWAREMREREAYLARSRDLSDLEARMRHLDDHTLSRGSALR
jgi:Protein of unknown function (DUF3563)